VIRRYGGQRSVFDAAVGPVEDLLDEPLRRLDAVLEDETLVGTVLVWSGDTHYREKLFSLFEPHTEAIRKGKAAKPTEFGKLVKMQEAEHGLVIDYEVYARRPADKTLLQPAIARHTEVFGRPPRLVAGDAGFWSGANRQAAEQVGVKRFCIPTTGPPAAAQRQRWFRRGLRWRTGCEGRISVLKRRDGLARCRYRGFSGMQRWVGWGVVAHDLHLLIHRDRRRSITKTSAAH